MCNTITDMIDRIYKQLYPETKVGFKNKSNNYGKSLDIAEFAISKPTFAKKFMKNYIRKLNTELIGTLIKLTICQL